MLETGSPPRSSSHLQGLHRPPVAQPSHLCLQPQCSACQLILLGAGCPSAARTGIAAAAGCWTASAEGCQTVSAAEDSACLLGAYDQTGPQDCRAGKRCCTTRHFSRTAEQRSDVVCPDSAQDRRAGKRCHGLVRYMYQAGTGAAARGKSAETGAQMLGTAVLPGQRGVKQPPRDVHGIESA